MIDDFSAMVSHRIDEAAITEEQRSALRNFLAGAVLGREDDNEAVSSAAVMLVESLDDLLLSHRIFVGMIQRRDR